MMFDLPGRASDAGPETEPDEQDGWTAEDEGDRRMDLEHEEEL